MRDAWKDEGWRARKLENLRQPWTPERRKRLGKAVKDSWADPAVRKCRLEAIRAAWTDPEKRAHMAKINRDRIATERAALRAVRPAKRGRKQETEDQKSYFRIGTMVEKEIPVLHSKHSIVTARRLVSERTHLEFDVIAKYHKQYRRMTRLQSARQA